LLWLATNKTLQDLPDVAYTVRANHFNGIISEVDCVDYHWPTLTLKRGLAWIALWEFAHLKWVPVLVNINMSLKFF
jgi:hypothetical protein